MIIVGAGGGLIKPMQRRWEDMLDKASEESKKVKNETQSDAPAYPSEPSTAAYPAGTYAGDTSTTTTYGSTPR